MRDLLEISAEGKPDEGKLCGLLSKVGLCARNYIDRPVDAKEAVTKIIDGFLRG